MISTTSCGLSLEDQVLVNLEKHFSTVSTMKGRASVSTFVPNTGILLADSSNIFSMKNAPGHENKPHGGEMFCRCHRSKCLKQYCGCFERGDLCSKGCRCKDCQNDGRHEKNRIASVKSRAIAYYGSELGCRCSQSKCVKKYCICFGSGQTCGQFCICKDCHNAEEAEETHEINFNYTKKIALGNGAGQNKKTNHSKMKTKKHKSRYPLAKNHDQAPEISHKTGHEDVILNPKQDCRINVRTGQHSNIEDDTIVTPMIEYFSDGMQCGGEISTRFSFLPTGFFSTYPVANGMPIDRKQLLQEIDEKIGPEYNFMVL